MKNIQYLDNSATGAPQGDDVAVSPRAANMD
jgi:hypothetical protein